MYPSLSTSWHGGSAPLLALSPASDMQRETRAAKWEENHKLFNPLKGASDGIHASHVRGMKAPPEAYKNKATITTPKTTEQKPTKSILWEKEWGKKHNEISFRSEERNQEGVSEKKKPNQKKSFLLGQPHFKMKAHRHTTYQAIQNQHTPLLFP